MYVVVVDDDVFTLKTKGGTNARRLFFFPKTPNVDGEESILVRKNRSNSPLPPLYNDFCAKLQSNAQRRSEIL